MQNHAETHQPPETDMPLDSIESGGEDSGTSEQLSFVKAYEDSNFPGSLIMKVRKGENTIGYALRDNGRGGLEGNEIQFTADGKIGATYQLHEKDIEELRAAGVIDYYQAEVERKAKAEEGKLLDEAEVTLTRIQLDSWIDPFNSYDPKNAKVVDALAAVGKLNDAQQEKLAERFFAQAIIKQFDTKGAYRPYGCLKGTAFSNKFRELEDARLKKAGYGGFIL